VRFSPAILGRLRDRYNSDVTESILLTFVKPGLRKNLECLMAFREGLYKVEFSTSTGQGAGVVTLLDGRVRGGDAAMYYTGSYALEEDNFNATIDVQRHTAGMQSVFGVDKVTLRLSGHFAGDDGVMQGDAAQRPGVRFSATVKRIAD
jgi:hypothetical protein